MAKYFLCTVQPELEETKRAGYVGEWFTVVEKRAAIEKFHRLRQTIPISVDHTAEKSFGSLVPKEQRTGRILDMLIDADGDLVAKCVLTKDSKGLRQVESGVTQKREKWGVSPRIDFCIPGGYGGDGTVIKALTHLALTRTPKMARQGTYIHHWSDDETEIDHIINREYYAEGQGHCFVAPAMADRLKSLGSMCIISFSLTHIPNDSSLLFCFIPNYALCFSACLCVVVLSSSPNITHCVRLLRSADTFRLPLRYIQYDYV